MTPRDYLEALRCGRAPDATETESFARAMGDAAFVSDAQLGAFAMGVFHTPLSRDARVALTTGMRDSGRLLEWDVPGPVVDKHSTGGVGDCVSLVLAPALAACGVFVPMISGRGLGHTGGTLDKLEAIPGFRCEQTLEEMQRITADVGCAIVAANAEIAPADARLYAVRDETGTVPSQDLITASILSKKLAAGLDALVLDIKIGSGAFMSGFEEAQTLAASLVDTAKGAGCPTIGLITDMNQPLAPSAGNALEVRAALDCLANQEGRLRRVVLALGGQLLDLASGEKDGAKRIDAVLANGAAMEQFSRMVAAQGGPRNVAERADDHLPTAPVIRTVNADQTGYIAGINTRAIGESVIGLGGGRRNASDQINPAVGVSEIVSLGRRVDQGEPLCVIHADKDDDADRAECELRAALRIEDMAPEAEALIKGNIA